MSIPTQYYSASLFSFPTTKNKAQKSKPDIEIPMPASHKNKATEQIGTVGVALGFLSGAAMLLSPFLAKHPKTLASTLLHRKPASLHQHWETLLADKKNLEQLCWRGLSVASLLTGMNNYETAKNTKQPSLIISNLLGYLFAIALFIKPKSIFLRSTAFITWSFLAMGKRNDIENGNHPTRRREWDLSRLKKGFYRGINRYMKELGSFTRFIAGDFKRTFSLKPWKELTERYDKKSEWETPQSYQIAISGQLFTLGFLTTFLTERYKTKNITPLLVTTGGIIYNLPFIVRAWQNRHEIENKAMLASVPISIIGDGFRVSHNFSHLTGLSSTSGMTSKSVEINSRRYRALLNYIDQLYHFAKENPTIHGQDIYMELQSHPWRIKRLEHELGKRRTEFLLELLHNASVAERTTKITLADYLAPIVLPSDKQRHLVKGLPPLAQGV